MGKVNQMGTVNLSNQLPCIEQHIQQTCSDNFHANKNCNQLDLNCKLQGSQQSTRAKECDMAEKFAVHTL